MRYLTKTNILSCIICVSVMGCAQKEIVFDDGSPRVVSVVFDWDNAAEAEVEGMTVFFYPISEGSRVWKYDIRKNGGKVELPVGCYRMIAVNNDLTAISFSNIYSFDDFQANVKRSDDLIPPTGMLYGGTIPELDVTQCGISYLTNDGIRKDSEEGILVCGPDTLSTVYNVEVVGIEGFERVTKLSSSLSGLPSDLRVVDESPLGIPSTTSFDMTLISEEKMEFKGFTTGFYNSSADNTYRLTLYASMTDRKTYSKSFDVTSQVINGRNPHDVYITVKDVVFPGSEDPSGPDDPDDDDIGLSVGVEGWNVVEIDYDTSKSMF